MKIKWVELTEDDPIFKKGFRYLSKPFFLGLLILI